MAQAKQQSRPRQAAPANKAAARPRASKRAPAKQTAAARPASRKTAVTQAGSRKTAATQPAAMKTAATQPASRKTAAKKTAATQPASKQPAAKKTAAKKTASRKTAAKKTAAKKTAATQPASRMTAATRVVSKKTASTPATTMQPATRQATTAKPATRKLATRPSSRTATQTQRPPVRPSEGGRVVEIVDDEHPIEALRRFLSTIEGPASIQQGQVALGAAQLMLLPIAHEHRGGPEVKELLDLVMSRWSWFPETTGFHAQEFLRNAFAAVGHDRERITRLRALVPPDASAELRFTMASAYAVLGDKPAMLEALRGALAGGVTPSQVRREHDFAPFERDSDLGRLLDGASMLAIPIDVLPYVRHVRAALDSVIATLKEFGEHAKLNPPAALDTVLAIERGRRIQLPNDYRALLTLSDGMTLWDAEFFGTLDYRTETRLAKRAKEFLVTSEEEGAIGMQDCVPLASWGEPNQWLLYDSRGTVRDGEPGYVVLATAEPQPISDLSEALERIELVVRDVLGTN